MTTPIRLANALPCPFCGSTYILSGYKFAAICNDCGATGPDKEHAPRALKAWNKRAPVVAEQGIVRTNYEMLPQDRWTKAEWEQALARQQTQASLALQKFDAAVGKAVSGVVEK